MTSIRPVSPLVIPRKPAHRPSRRLGLAALAAVTIALMTGGTARAGWDDFEFGQKLIQKGLIGQAQKVFEGILNDSRRSQIDKDRAKFGMALLGKADAQGTARRMKPFAKYADVKAKFDVAVGSIREFVNKNSGDAKADDARFQLGEVCFWFADWCSSLLNGESPAENGTLADRDAKVADLRTDAESAVRTADEVFVGLARDAKTEGSKKTAKFQAATSKYVLGRLLEHCSAKALSAFGEAKRALDEYVTDEDGYLAAVFAHDKLGLTYWELADCESPGKQQEQFYREAISEFSAAASTENQGDDFLKIICLGYLHAGQFANHFASANDSPARGLMTDARKLLMGMEKRVKSTTSQETGILALVEWANVEAKFENWKEAIAIAKRASDLAQAGQFGYAKSRADSALGEIVEGSTKGGGGASEGTTDAGVIFKVGEDLKRKGEFAKAIGAFQQAILSAPPTRDGLLTYVLPGWTNIGECYSSMKPALWLEAAIAYDSVLDEVRSGRIKILTDNDPPSRIAYGATVMEKKALKMLGDVTGDPTIRERANVLERWSIPVFKDYGGGTGDAAYVQARRAFDDADKAKREADGQGGGWKKGFLDSRPYFEDVSKNTASDYQDNALTYLARLQYEIGDFAACVAAADQALSWWKGPESEKRTKARGDAAKRQAQQAQTTFWKCVSLHELKRDDEALTILDTYVKDFGSSAGDFRGRAMGLQIEILLSRNKVEEAEALLGALVQDFPEYYGLGPILAKVSAYYGDQVKAIQAKITVLTEKMVGPPGNKALGLVAQGRALDKETTTTRTTISDIHSAIEKHSRIANNPDAPPTEKLLSEKELIRLRADLVTAQASLKAGIAKRAEIDKQLDALGTERTELKKQKVGPLKKAVGFDRRLDDVRRKLDAQEAPGGRKRRRSGLVSYLAAKYFELAKLEPEVTDDWSLAKSLYEDYLAFPDIADKPDADDGKRLAFQALGDVYVHLADAATSPEERRGFSASAVKYLQSTIAKNPVNNGLLVASLALEIVPLNFEDANSGKRWRIPVRKVATVEEFRKYVSELSGDRLPRYVKEETQKQYMNAVTAFQAEIKAASDAKVQGIVNKLKDGGFDPVFFTEHANSQPEFLLSLATAYVHSGIAENLPKALNVARVVTANSNPNKPEDDTPDWWQAQTIQLEVFVGIAEQEAVSGGDSSAAAKKYAKDADSILSTYKRMFPYIGGADRHTETLAEWKALQDRLTHIMGKLGLTPSLVDLESAAPPPPPDPTPTPTPAPDKPPEPAMTDETPMDPK